MSELPASKPDRRQSPRTRLVEIAYIGMGPENGGLVLDVSDGGLSFHSVAPVQQSETIRFLLSLRGHSRVEGAGEVVWTNDARTVCGLKFTSLSSGARDHLNNWTNQSRPPAPGSEAPVSPAAQVHAEPPAIPDEQPHSPEEEPPISAVSESEAGSEPLFAIPPADRVFLSEPEGKSQPGGHLFLWILFVLLGATAIVSAFLYGVHVGQLEVSPAALSAAPSVIQPTAPAPAPLPAPATPPTASSDAAPVSSPAPVSAPAPSGAASIPNVAPAVPGAALVNATKTGDATANTPPATAAEGPAAAVSDLRAAQAAEAGKSQLADAMVYLNAANGQRDSAKAAKQLWAAVGNRNSDAEIILAGLYATGDGVPKSCEQGRVLLIAAERAGNPKAKVTLDELNAKGCK
jgi:PilZ domain-containing protein